VNWEAFCAIGERVGAIAVIVTIAYLAIQVRQNTSALRSAATLGATDEATHIYHTLSTDPELAMIFVRGSAVFDELNDSQVARFYSFYMLIMFSVQNWYFQTRDGLIEESLLASWTRLMQQAATAPGVQQFWNDRRFVFAQEFQAWMEAEVFGKASEAVYKPLGVGEKL